MSVFGGITGIWGKEKQEPQQSQDTVAGGSEKPDAENNKTDDVSISDDFWNPASQKEPANAAPVVNVQMPSPPVAPQDAFQNYVDSLDFGTKDFAEMSQEDREKLASGDFTPLSKSMKDAAKNAYKHAIMDMDKIIKPQIEKAVNAAVSKADGRRYSDELVKDMEHAHPFTAQPALSPVAKSVLKQALEKGQTKQEAIATVARFFKTTAQHVNGGNGSEAPSGSGSFAGKGQKDMDWMNFLTETGGAN